MKILRVNMNRARITSEDIPEHWKLIGGSGLIAKIMNKEVPPDTDPLGPRNKLIIACGPLAGTIAPQLGRISVGAKSPLTFGIKEANSGGPAAQKLDKLGIRSIVFEGIPEKEELYCLKISNEEAALVSADEYRGMKTYELVSALHKKYGRKTAIICTGIAGERKYRSASVAFTDVRGDPSRNAARGGLGAVMGSKGLKAIVIDSSGASPVDIVNPDLFKKTVKSWVNTIKHDVSCGLFAKYGTPFAVANSGNQGTLPWKNYRSGRPRDFRAVSGEVIQKNLFERGGKMHACMPGCVVRCSIIYPDVDGKHLASAYEYEAIAMLGTNLGILDPDAIGRLKFICDDLGIDLIETGSCLGVAADAGKMKMGDVESAIKLLAEIEQETELGRAIANGVVRTAEVLNVRRIPAYKGQAIPGHDPRAVKGIGTTYATSPMGADHTAGLTYRTPLQTKGQNRNSLRFQIQAAICDTFGYCINSIPSGPASLYGFLAQLASARYGLSITEDDIVEIGKQTLKDQLKFNEGSEFSRIHERYPAFVRTEALPPTDHVFDVADSEIEGLWNGLQANKHPKKIWEIRIPPLPDILFGTGTIQRLGEQAKRLNLQNILIITDPVMNRLGRTDQVREILKDSGIDSAVFSEVEPDPPVELIEKAGRF